MSSAPSELKNIIMRAGAGAGKTTALTKTFLEFAQDFKNKNDKFPRIVVTTFTRKATQELKERLAAKALADGREDLFQFVNSKSQVQISTIHGVLSLFLSRYGSTIGLTPDYKILSDAEVRKGARKIMRRLILENQQNQELLEEYDFLSLEGILLKYFSESVVFPNMKFIEKTELQKETEKLVSDLAGKVKRVCYEIEHEAQNDKWQEYARSLGGFSWTCENQDWASFFDRLTTFWEFLSKPVFKKASAPFSLTLNEELESLRDQIDGLLEGPQYRPEFWDRHQRNCEVFDKLAKDFCRDFMQIKLDSGLLSMADLETLAMKIMVDAPEAAGNFANEWDFWMVDEYQDTSPMQVEILRQLIGSKPVFVVGDPQQSIYLFRGARSEVFQEKVDEVRKQQGIVDVRLVNYRSSPEVLEFFNHYFTRLSSQFAAMTPDDKKVRKGAANPVVQVLITENGSDEIVSSEVLTTVARIQELLANGVSPEQICVLGRTHKTLEDIAKVSQEYGVPLQLHSGSGFYERREVLDALSLLKFIVNPHDNKNFVALLRMPWLVLSDSEILMYCHQQKNSFWTEAQKNSASLAETHPVRLLQNILLQSEIKGISYAFKNSLIELGFFDYSARIDSTGRREANLWKVVYLLYQEERRPGFNFLDFLDASLDTLSAEEGGEDADATPVIEPKRVNFMTVHASKGLQFEQVILAGMGQDPRAAHSPLLSFQEADGTWSLKIRNDETQAMMGSILADQIRDEMRRREAEEFNRVLYVAMTRAKEGVTLIWNSKIGKKSWAAQCPLILDEGLQQEKDFSYLVRKENLQPQKMAEADVLIKKLRPFWQNEETAEKKKMVSVTELVSDKLGKANTQTNAAVSGLGAGLARAQQGTNAHKIFEALKYTSFEALLADCDGELKKPLQFLAKSQDIPLLEIIEKGHVEWGFTLEHKNYLLQGQIDLWGVIDNTVWIVDYKTGSQRYTDQAIKQLEVYAWALKKMKYIDQSKTVKVVVVYPLEEVIKIKDLPEIVKDLDFNCVG